MPQLQVVDTTERPPEPTGVQEFFSKLHAHYRDKEDQNQISNIWEQFLENEAQKDNYIRTQVAFEKSKLPPSKGCRS